MGERVFALVDYQVELPDDLAIVIPYMLVTTSTTTSACFNR